MAWRLQENTIDSINTLIYYGWYPSYTIQDCCYAARWQKFSSINFNFQRVRLFKFTASVIRSSGIGMMSLSGCNTGFVLIHHKDIIWASWCLKSPATWLFVRQLVHTNNKNIKALYYWSFVRGICQSLVSSPHKAPVMQEAFLCHYIMMI